MTHTDTCQQFSRMLRNSLRSPLWNVGNEDNIISGGNVTTRQNDSSVTNLNFNLLKNGGSKGALSESST
jgi:hypothetical protein